MLHRSLEDLLLSDFLLCVHELVDAAGFSKYTVNICLIHSWHIWVINAREK